MSLSGPQRQQLQKALVDAFPTKASLEQMLSFKLDQNLEAIAGEGNLENIIHNLIKKANAEGWIKKLLSAARDVNPGNPQLQAIDQELLASETQTDPSINISETKRTVKDNTPTNNSFLKNWMVFLAPLLILVTSVLLIINNAPNNNIASDVIEASPTSQVLNIPESIPNTNIKEPPTNRATPTIKDKETPTNRATRLLWLTIFNYNVLMNLIFQGLGILIKVLIAGIILFSIAYFFLETWYVRIPVIVAIILVVVYILFPEIFNHIVNLY